MLTGLKYQLELFWLSLGFFSRLPIPSDTPYSEQRMNQAGRYFALVGLLLGCLCALVYWVASTLFSTEVAVFLMMCFSLMLTGAFHEDGLTDMADGIGGGMTVERRLTIMKDSRIGTYGASALVMALLGKFVFLSQLAQSADLVVVIITVYAFSRGVAASLIYDMPYVSDIDTSKSKPLANKQSQLELTILIVTSLLPLICFDTGLMVALVVSALVFRFALKRWLLKRLGGFTGDCLGAAQQLTELLSYLVILAWFGV
ncbi:adenosylcobinamide-GDP ribazoletransferase [Vibrio hepatarius]|uniref:adenosylcobinamide-GDP ribazoletransferase n=1 Tax=Vibrio hepatarius TaxID=171383 RepID=UPI00148C5461|nr:adenosylcobinamide-GDP ribazoletransferase [Vibrio hepatarius]NOI15558.1 adenosylcobinamide-GDP ribazoletransferase [Vibrio hepatarius]